MQINVSQLLKEHVGSYRTISISSIDIETSRYKEFDISGEISLIRTENGILVKGELTSSGKGTCCRCLKSTAYFTKFSIEEEYLPTIDINTGLPLPVKDEMLTIDNHHNINLSEALYQYAILAIPMKILCNNNCAGICPVCGKNLNEGKCSCNQVQYDLRWSKLLALKKEAENNGTTSKKKIRKGKARKKT